MIKFGLAADMWYFCYVWDTQGRRARKERSRREEEGRKEGDVWLSSLASACKVQALCGTMFPGSANCRWYLEAERV